MSIKTSYSLYATPVWVNAKGNCFYDTCAIKTDHLVNIVLWLKEQQMWVNPRLERALARRTCLDYIKDYKKHYSFEPEEDYDEDSEEFTFFEEEGEYDEIYTENWLFSALNEITYKDAQ